MGGEGGREGGRVSGGFSHARVSEMEGGKKGISTHTYEHIGEKRTKVKLKQAPGVDERALGCFKAQITSSNTLRTKGGSEPKGGREGGRGGGREDSPELYSSKRRKLTNKPCAVSGRR